MFKIIDDSNWDLYTKKSKPSPTLIPTTKPEPNWSKLATACQIIKCFQPNICQHLMIYVYYIAKGARKIQENTNMGVNDLQKDELSVYRRIQYEFNSNPDLKDLVTGFMSSEKYTRRDLSFFLTKYAKAQQLTYFISKGIIPPVVQPTSAKNYEEVNIHKAYKTAKKVYINSKNIMNPYAKTVTVEDMDNSLGITLFLIWFAKKGGIETYIQHYEKMCQYRKTIQAKKQKIGPCKKKPRIK